MGLFEGQELGHQGASHGWGWCGGAPSGAGFVELECGGYPKIGTVDGLIWRWDKGAAVCVSEL